MIRISYAARSGAGRYATDRYVAGLRTWRRSIRRIALPLLAPVFVSGLVLAFIARDQLAWCAGFMVGASAAIYCLARDPPPAFVETGRRGAEGERATARVLGPLRREGWQLFHDLDTGHGNRDHVAIGPTGVYLLDSKKLSGTVAVDGDAIRAIHRDYPRDDYSLDRVGTWMRGEAARLKSEIETATGERVWVQAVVVVWGHFPDQRVDGDRVTFLHGDVLSDWLREHPGRLSAAARQKVATALQRPSASSQPAKPSGSHQRNAPGRASPTIGPQHRT